MDECLGYPYAIEPHRLRRLDDSVRLIAISDSNICSQPGAMHSWLRFSGLYAVSGISVSTSYDERKSTLMA